MSINSQKKKIQIPSIFFDVPLHQKTESYWKLSRCWNNVEPNKHTVSSALKETNRILTDLNPNRTLSKRVEGLKNDIVMHGSKSNKSKHDNIIVVSKVYVL